jgi:tol-pal system beta propeller repeat protein TolB
VRSRSILILAALVAACQATTSTSTSTSGGSTLAPPTPAAIEMPTTSQGAGPSRSPNEGPSIAFHSDPDGNDDFYQVGADGSGLRALTSRDETVAFPYWSPDGSRIAYLCCGGQRPSLWVMDADGSNSRRLTDGHSGSPAWSPDGTRIAFDDNDDGAIDVIGADGTRPVRLAEDSGGAQWSPDGKAIVFFSWRDFPGQDQRNELYSMHPDGSEQVRLTTNEAEDVEPRWSPDGRRIIFVSTRDGNEEIYVVAADGSRPRRLTDDASADESPAWSPDGSRILFTSYRDGADPHMLGEGDAEIFTVRPDGSGLTNLTNAVEWDGYPAWSPDGRRIAFSTNGGVEFDLFVMDADGQHRRQLPGPTSASGVANDCCPAWRP